MATQSTTTPTTTTTITTTMNPCSSCGQLTVLMNDPTLNQPVTQTTGTDANGCTTVTITCTNPNGGQFFNNGVDMGTDSSTGTVTDTLTCNAQGQLVLTLNGAMSVITDVECLAA